MTVGVLELLELHATFVHISDDFDIINRICVNGLFIINSIFAFNFSRSELFSLVLFYLFLLSSSNSGDCVPLILSGFNHPVASLTSYLSLYLPFFAS